MRESQDIESATTAMKVDGRPDDKTRRYDRQLRLWAATGQTALENARILVISGTATSTSILKNLVLPGIGHFTILDPADVSPEDAGNNFFLEGPSSIGKSRAEETVRLLCELNDGVDGKADRRSLADVLESDVEYLTSFSLVIAHNLETQLLDRLSELLWSDPTFPILVVVNAAGFVTEFGIQFREHTIIESHTETAPSLRIDKPFPALLDYALSLDFANMDSTEHAHIPYVVILVRAMEEWKKSHDGLLPQTYGEKKAFKEFVLGMRTKFDEENFEEAEAQAYRCWTSSAVPSDIRSLFSDPKLDGLMPDSPPFWHLLAALKTFTEREGMLPLTSTLPDMKASTTSYIHLQKLYKARAEEEKEVFKSYLAVPVDQALVDLFVKNSHGIKVMRGKRWGELDRNPAALAGALATSPKPAATHLALSALRLVKEDPTKEALTAVAKSLLPPDTVLPDEFEDAVGEIARAPTAELPNTAAFLGGLVAQETIKMITKQYVPIGGICVADLIETWTGVV